MNPGFERETPGGLPPEPVAGTAFPPSEGAFVDSLQVFSESLRSLRETCAELSSRCADLDWALKDSNRKLRKSLDDRERIASRLDRILWCVPVGVVGVDPKGTITDYNRAAETITGYAKETVLGLPCGELFGKGAGPQPNLLRALETGVGSEGEERDLIAADGTRIPIRSRTALVRGENEKILGAVEVIEDLRRARLVEEELVRTRTLVALGEAAAEVARQIRNPLAGLSGFAELLARDLEPDPERGKLVRKIREGVASVEHAVDRFLESARSDRMRCRCVDLVGLLQRALDLFEAGLEPTDRIRIRRAIHAPQALALVDGDQLTVVYRQLLGNARDAMPDGGEITVTLEVRRSRMDGASARPGGNDLESIMDPESTVVVSFRDTGEGMPPEVLDNAFSPFFSTRDRRLGLGLTTVRRILTSHGGDIVLESRPGCGTTAIVRLPAAHIMRAHPGRRAE